MTYRKTKIIYRLIFIFIAVIPVSCFKSLTETNIVYENNFDAGFLNNMELYGWIGTTAFGPVTDSRIQNFAGRTILGKFNNNQVLLKLQNLPTHNSLRVEFDLYLHNNWKNELWHMSVDGKDKLITGFSNDPAVQQSYPNWIGSATGPAGQNAQETVLPGSCTFVNAVHGSSMYRIVTTITHDLSTVTFSANDAGGAFNDTCSRSWSLDNFKVSVFKN